MGTYVEKFISPSNGELDINLDSPSLQHHWLIHALSNSQYPLMIAIELIRSRKQKTGVKSRCYAELTEWFSKHSPPF
jgi:hypothetical protein